MGRSRLRSRSSPACRSYPWLIVGACCIAGFMGQIDASIVQLALPTLGRVFDCTLESVSWVALAYLLGCRSVHADLRPALPDLWQEAVLHRRLRRVHVGQRSLRLRAGSPHPCRASVPARRGRGDDWRQQHGACRRGDGQEPARARAWALCRRPSGRDQRRSCRGRTVDRDFGLALGVLGQRSLRADLDRRRLAGASGHGAAESETNVRLARRSPARAGFDARGVRAQSGVRARARPRPCSWVLSAPRSCSSFCSSGRRAAAQSPLVDLALLEGPAFLAGALACALSYAMLYGMFFLASFALVRGYEDSPIVAGLKLAIVPISIGIVAPIRGRRSPTGWARASSASQEWRYALSRCSR